MTKLDSVVETLIAKAKNKLQQRNESLQNSIDDFIQELPKHKSFLKNTYFLYWNILKWNQY